MCLNWFCETAETFKLESSIAFMIMLWAWACSDHVCDHVWSCMGGVITHDHGFLSNSVRHKICSISCCFEVTFGNILSGTVWRCPSPILSRKHTNSSSSLCLIGSVREWIVNNGHNVEDLIDALMICACVPFLITGHVWWKSPRRMMGILPNNCLLFLIWWHVSSTW